MFQSLCIPKGRIRAPFRISCFLGNGKKYLYERPRLTRLFSFVRNEKVSILYVSTELGLNLRICRFDFFPVLFLFFMNVREEWAANQCLALSPSFLLWLYKNVRFIKGLASYFLYSDISPTLNLIKTIHNCGLNWGLEQSTI